MAKALRQALNGDRDAAVYDWLIGASARQLSRRYSVKLDHVEQVLDEERADVDRGSTVEAIQRMEIALSIELAKVEEQRREHDTLRPALGKITKANSWWYGREAHLSGAARDLREQRIKCIEIRHRMQHGSTVNVNDQRRGLQDLIAETRADRGLGPLPETFLRN